MENKVEQMKEKKVIKNHAGQYTKVSKDVIEQKKNHDIFQHI